MAESKIYLNVPFAKRMKQKRSAQGGMLSKRNGLSRQIRTLRSLHDGKLNPVPWSRQDRRLQPPKSALHPIIRLPVSKPMQRLKDFVAL